MSNTGKPVNFVTVEKPFVTETEEKKSRFIAHLVPFREFDNMLTNLRDEHRKASHYVTAFRMIKNDNQILENAKDDGEPAGTSGMPVLKTMIGSRLIDAGIIVVRYFGGTKLGTGGLARAYAGAAQAVIRDAALCSWQRFVSREISASFEASSELERRVLQLKLVVIERVFDETGVHFIIRGPEEEMSQL